LPCFDSRHPCLHTEPQRDRRGATDSHFREKKPGATAISMALTMGGYKRNARGGSLRDTMAPGSEHPCAPVQGHGPSSPLRKKRGPDCEGHSGGRLGEPNVKSAAFRGSGFSACGREPTYILISKIFPDNNIACLRWVPRPQIAARNRFGNNTSSPRYITLFGIT
jgi:hypothetical protein